MAQAENLLRMGLHPSQIVQGYKRAGARALEMIEELTVYKLTNISDVTEVRI